MPRPADGIPQDIDQHMRLMCDILVLAFRTDTTRVCTLKLNNDHSSLRFPQPEGGLHDPPLAVALRRRRLAEGQPILHASSWRTSPAKLDKVQEGERTLLDNSMILYCSSMMTGNHDNNQLPVVLLGRGGGQIKSGRVLDYLNKPNRKMCSLYLSLLDKAGVRLGQLRRLERTHSGKFRRRQNVFNDADSRGGIAKSRRLSTCDGNGEVPPDRHRRLQARIRKKGYVSGVAAGTLLDKKTGAHDLGFGLHIMDFLMAPGWADDGYPRDPKLHGNLPKHYVEGPQICTQAKELRPKSSTATTSSPSICAIASRSRRTG